MQRPPIHYNNQRINSFSLTLALMWSHTPFNSLALSSTRFHSELQIPITVTLNKTTYNYQFAKQI